MRSSSRSRRPPPEALGTRHLTAVIDDVDIEAGLGKEFHNRTVIERCQVFPMPRPLAGALWVGGDQLHRFHTHNVSHGCDRLLGYRLNRCDARRSIVAFAAIAVPGPGAGDPRCRQRQRRPWRWSIQATSGGTTRGRERRGAGWLRSPTTRRRGRHRASGGTSGPVSSLAELSQGSPWVVHV